MELVDKEMKEVVDLHAFFEAWFNGVLPRSQDAFNRFTSVIAESFAMVTPDGRTIQRGELVDRIWHAHGAHAGDESPFRIWIENLRSQALGGGLCLVAYEEWQQTGGVTRGRLSSALLRLKEGTPSGVAWLHVHETWLPPEAYVRPPG